MSFLKSSDLYETDCCFTLSGMFLTKYVTIREGCYNFECVQKEKEKNVFQIPYLYYVITALT